MSCHLCYDRLMLWFVSWELDCTPVPLCFSKSEIQKTNRQTSQDL